MGGATTDSVDFPSELAKSADDATKPARLESNSAAEGSKPRGFSSPRSNAATVRVTSPVASNSSEFRADISSKSTGSPNSPVVGGAAPSPSAPSLEASLFESSGALFCCDMKAEKKRKNQWKQKQRRRKNKITCKNAPGKKKISLLNERII
jgi:hypothetical protein